MTHFCDEADLHEVLQVALKGTAGDIGQQPLAVCEGQRRALQKSRGEQCLAWVQRTPWSAA